MLDEGFEKICLRERQNNRDKYLYQDRVKRI